MLNMEKMTMNNSIFTNEIKANIKVNKTDIEEYKTVKIMNRYFYYDENKITLNFILMV